MGMEIRPARVEDGPAFLELVQCLAHFEELPPPDPEACERLLRDAFSAPPRYQLWVADQGDAIVAYAAWFLTYSTFLARPTLYLEDLFVSPEARRRGVATAMMDALKREAQRLECGRFEWSVLDWNDGAQALYRRLGADAQEAWQLMRIVL